MSNISIGALHLWHLSPTSSRKPCTRCRSAGVGLLVAGLHILAMWLWLVSAVRPNAAQSSNRVATVTVLLQAQPEPAVEEPKLETQARHPTPAVPAPTDRKAAGATVPLAELPAGAGTAAPVAEGASPRAPAAPPPLNLTLPRGALSALAKPSLAAQSAFQAPLPLTVERQIAAVAGESGPWEEERLDYDHLRLRRGNTCVMLERPAASRIDPSNDALQRLPWLVNVQKCPQTARARTAD